MSNSGKKKAADDDEVEQLLRAAQDDMLLKLNLNSHMARGSAAAAIDPDLDRRFLALKKPQKPPKVDDPTKSVPAKVDSGGSRVDGASDDDLFARFTALKNTIPSHNKSESRSNLSGDAPANQPAAEEEEESEDEVEKVMKWAIDAARLDPSQPSDDDDDDYDCSDDEDDCSDDDDDDVKGKKNKSK
ncbi:hypothetical protein ABFS83_05G057600 [Erythranthe nasuta]